jgi:DNA replication protein DnaC
LRDEISKYQKKLKLSNKLLEIYPSIDVETHEEFLLELLKALNEDREEKRRIRNLNSAGFSVIKTLDDYNYSQVQFPSSLKIQDLESLTFIERKENLILYGAVGTGKTHLSVALGVKAISQGKKAVFYRVHDLCICQPKIRSKDHSILGHFLVNKCASENCTKAQSF